MTAIGPVLAAVYGALNVASLTAAPPTGLNCRVYDNVPQLSLALFPYIRIAAPTENRMDTFAREIRNGTVWVHVFSRNLGAKESAAILTQAEALLDDVELAVSGHSLFGLHCEDTLDLGEEQIDGIGKVRHYVQVYRVWTHQ